MRDRLGINGKVYAADMSITAPALKFADGEIRLLTDLTDFSWNAATVREWQKLFGV